MRPEISLPAPLPRPAPAVGAAIPKPLWFLAFAAFAIGLPGVFHYLSDGHLAANYGSYVPWGLWVGSYIYFIGLSAGAFLLSSLVYVFGVKRFEPIGKLALFTALVCLAGSVSTIWLDLGHPTRAWRLLLSTNFSSVMGWMAWFYSSYFLLLVAELWLALKPDLIRVGRESSATGYLARALVRGRGRYSPEEEQRDRRLLKILGTLGVPLAVAFHGGVGALFGVIGARPYWHSGLLPILFLVGALLSGGALLTALVVMIGPGRGTRQHRELVESLAKIVLGVLALDLLLEWAEYSVGMYASVPAHSESMRLVLFGPYWWAFWVLHAGLGVAIPLVLLLGRGKSLAMVGVATALIALTFFTVRLNIIIPGLAVPELHGLAGAFHHPRLAFDYYPSTTEWLLQLWVVSLMGLAFLLGLKLLPLNRTEEG